MFRKYLLPLLALVGIVFAVYSVVAAAEALSADAKSQWQRAETITERNAISQEELMHRKYTFLQADAAAAQAKANLATLKAGTWAPDLEIAKADVENAKASLEA